MLTALWFAPLFLVTAWLGHPWFTLLIALVAAIGALELYRMMGLARSLLFAGILLTLLLVLSALLWQPGVWTVLPTLALLLALARRLRPASGGSSPYLVMLGGALYLGWLLGLWLALRGLEGGREWALFALLVTFASDTIAYFVGRRWGRHRLAPHISPGKTWEGTLGGIAGALVTAFLLSLPLGGLVMPFSPFLLLLPFLMSLAGLAGDLLESAFKRRAGVKESGGLLPGHGGVLDRLDSLAFTGPLAYYYLVLWIG